MKRTCAHFCAVSLEGVDLLVDLVALMLLEGAPVAPVSAETTSVRFIGFEAESFVTEAFCLSACGVGQVSWPHSLVVGSLGFLTREMTFFWSLPLMQLSLIHAGFSPRAGTVTDSGGG